MNASRIFFLLCAGAAIASADTPKLTLEKTGTANTYKLQWQSLTNSTYFLQQSSNLTNWTYFPEVMPGIGGTDFMGISTVADKRFFRILSTDVPTIDPITADHDGDGIPSFAELTITHTDPLIFSTAGNGVSDRGLFPNPSSGIYIDSANGIQYSLLANPTGVSGPKRIIPVPNFVAPDYVIQVKKAEKAQEKLGYVPFGTAGSTSSVRYLKKDRYLSAVDLNYNYISGNWEYGESQGNSLPLSRFVIADYNSYNTNTINALTGAETVTGPGLGNRYAFTASYWVPHVLNYAWNYEEPDFHGVWMGYVIIPPIGTIEPGYYNYDRPPYSTGWDGPADLYYEEELYSENTIANVSTALRATPPAYPTTYVDGNPWAIWDVWSNQMGITYSRLKFRIKNKNGVTNGEPAKAYIFFDPKSGGPREELATVEWNGQGQYSPEYTIDPAILKPNVEGVFHTSLASIFFELDITQAEARKNNQTVIIPIPDEPEGEFLTTDAGDGDGPQTMERRGPSTLNDDGSTPIPDMRFPGMDETWYEGATITLTKVSGNGYCHFRAEDPAGGFSVEVPLGANLADDFFSSRGAYSSFNWKVEGSVAGPVTFQLAYTKGPTTLSITRSALVIGKGQMLTDLNNDGSINAADSTIRKNGALAGATAADIEAATEYMFRDDQLSNGAWDKDDTDPARPSTNATDDDVEPISVTYALPSTGFVYFDHPAINGLSFYSSAYTLDSSTRLVATPSSPMELTPTRSLPSRVYCRCDGSSLAFSAANPQLAGDLKLYYKPSASDPPILLSTLKLTVVSTFGAQKFFAAARDYIGEQNSELFIKDRTFLTASGLPSASYRLCVMREEATKVLPYEVWQKSYMTWLASGSPTVFDPYIYREAAGLTEVMAQDASMTVVINGNQCGFASGMSAEEALALSLLGKLQISDKCQGRIRELGQGISPVSSDWYDPATNAPGTAGFKGSPLAGPDPIPGTSPPQPGGKYIAQYLDGSIVVGAGYAPGSYGPAINAVQTEMGGLSSSYSLADRNNYPNSIVGHAPSSVQGQGMVFVAMGKNGDDGLGGCVEFYNAAVASGVPQIPGAAAPSGSLPPITAVFLDSGKTSCGLAHKNPSNSWKVVFAGIKHEGKPYFTNTFLRFKASKPRP